MSEELHDTRMARRVAVLRRVHAALVRADTEEPRVVLAPPPQQQQHHRHRSEHRSPAQDPQSVSASNASPSAGQQPHSPASVPGTDEAVATSASRPLPPLPGGLGGRSTSWAANRSGVSMSPPMTGMRGSDPSSFGGLGRAAGFAPAPLRRSPDRASMLAIRAGVQVSHPPTPTLASHTVL